MKKILITGGTGYIGSHTIVELLAVGYEVVAVDNFMNSKPDVLQRLEKITGTKIPFAEVDVCDKEKLTAVFIEHKPDAVIHFAGLKAVGESVANPLGYYANNLDSTLVLCEVMQEQKVHNLIFSSSATVYGTPSELPLKETSTTGSGITNPYGQTKFMIEQILRDVVHAYPEWSVTALRYFNPVGAHSSGLIGEDPKGVPNNLLPYISQVASGQLEKLKIYGDDYDTVDGTGVRDYIHVVDLARGHIAALDHQKNSKGYSVYNLGTGKGSSVLEAVQAFHEASGKDIPYEIVPRRPGDVASAYGDPSKANKELGWEAALSLEDACRDSWRWQQFARTL